MAVGLSGCSGVFGDPAPDEPPTPGRANTLDPDDHILGATGEWSSFGCNATNNRSVEDEQAPVDGVEERWRVPLEGHSGIREPLVADGIVYFTQGSTLTAYDADDGTKRWSAAIEDFPLVWEGLVYVPTECDEAECLTALDPETGEQLWSHSFDERVGSPCTFAGRWLMFAVGERIVWFDLETRTVASERQVFGPVFHPPAAPFDGTVTVTTQAGHVYSLSEGEGFRQWRLPVVPKSAPVYDQDGCYVNCRDGKTYAMGLDDGSSLEVAWSVRTGWAEYGIAVAASQLFTAGSRKLTAVDAESGEQAWTYANGEWAHTAPVYGRDTVFVGGDKLYALDPDPGGNLGDGPAVRYTRDLGGRVGPGPVLNDGRLYVVAGPDGDDSEEKPHLYAFDPV